MPKDSFRHRWMLRRYPDEVTPRCRFVPKKEATKPLLDSHVTSAEMRARAPSRDVRQGGKGLLLAA